MEGLGFIIILIIAVAVLAFLMPFFVFRIRNELISMNQKMTELLKILGGSNTNFSNIEVTNSGKRIKKCIQCGANNKFEDYKCMGCGAPLP